MLQARVRGGSDPRWFRPDRDMAYALMDVMRLTIDRLATKYEQDPARLERLRLLSPALGAMMRHEIIVTVPADKIRGLFESFGATHSAVFKDFMEEFFYTTMECYRNYAGDLVPGRESGEAEKAGP